ncbi:MAG: hypothetical protein PVI23_11450 [Maricaulaceae bacterium]|jgi:folate-binding protein YgfZ
MSAFVPLLRRGVVRVSGPDAAGFLDGLLTCDLDGAPDAAPTRGALLTPQGKLLAELWLHRREGVDGWLIDLPRGEVADFVKRLTLFKLRANVEIEDRSDDLVVEAGVDSPARRIVDAADAAAPTEDDLAAYDAARIARGEAEQGVDYGPNEVFPSDVNLDLLGGVAYAKGCFVGQEVVSRMKRRGTIRKRTLVMSTEDGPPASGAPITADGSALGQALSSAGGKTLALVRLDRLAAADPGAIRVEDRPARIDFPDWFPEDAKNSGASEGA